MDLADRIQLYVLRAVRLLLFVALFFEIANAQWFNLFLTLLTLHLTFLPFFVKQGYNVSIPLELELLTMLLICGGIYLGEIQAYYDRFWWWDNVLHTLSGMVLGLLAFILVFVLNSRNAVSFHLSPGFMAIFAFSFAVCIGVVWEVFEFGMDKFFGMNMQRGEMGEMKGLVDDTMWDLIVDALGAMIVSVAGYFYLRGGKVFLFQRFIYKFVEKNPSLFERFLKKKKRRWHFFGRK